MFEKLRENAVEYDYSRGHIISNTNGMSYVSY